MSSVEHAYSTGPAVMEDERGGGGGGGGQQASSLVTKQAVEFPQIYWLVNNYFVKGRRGLKSTHTEVTQLGTLPYSVHVAKLSNI